MAEPEDLKELIDTLRGRIHAIRDSL